MRKCGSFHTLFQDSNPNVVQLLPYQFHTCFNLRCLSFRLFKRYTKMTLGMWERVDKNEQNLSSLLIFSISPLSFSVSRCKTVKWCSCKTKWRKVLTQHHMKKLPKTHRERDKCFVSNDNSSSRHKIAITNN